MYLYIDKQSQAVVHVASVSAGDDRPPEQVYRDFDPKTMTVGRITTSYIPGRFEVHDGIVIDLDAPPPPEAPPSVRPESLADARSRVLRELTQQALAERAALVPDYQMLNAGLGLYEPERVDAIRATVQAFRAEVNRLETAVAKARSVEALDELKPSFPTALVVPVAPTAPAAPGAQVRAKKA